MADLKTSMRKKTLAMRLRRPGVPALVILSSLILASGCVSEVNPASRATGAAANTGGSATASADGEAAPAPYDSSLAARLGADEYGMRRYVMAFLKAGPYRSRDSAAAVELQRAHLQNIRRMAEAGDLLLAGPFLDDGVVRGIYVFDVETVEEARALTETDPAIQAGSLEMELHPWYGSAGLKEVNDIHARITRENP